MTGPQRLDRLETSRVRLPAADRDLRGSFMQLTERFNAKEAQDVDARWVIEIAAHGQYTIHISDGRCSVSAGAHPEGDATLTTDVDTWFDLVDGRCDGISAFACGRLVTGGDLNLALRLGSLFRPGPESSRFIRTTHSDAHGVELESLVVGRGTPVVLLHGLAASKVSFLPMVDGLADRYELHALDLPGFGKSDKPLPAGRRYSMRWMADVVHAYLRSHGLRRAYIVGNSMGGRIAVELALRHPRRVAGVVALCPAVAFDQWQWLAPALRVLQGHWVGLAPFPVQRATVHAAIADMFYDASALPPGNLSAAADEFLRGVRDRRHRLAILACARHLGAERASGRRSFWRALEQLTLPSYWIFGQHDRLVSSRYSERVRDRLPQARCEVWEEVGHVPQFEAPELTNERVGAFLDELEAPRS
ncbi:MAG TPA: alpha/beta fold hydrolase [Nitriliruptorales bacterium]|nr:alpha/beta fold hydrolase [Nitriliruptorales bacterium]